VRSVCIAAIIRLFVVLAIYTANLIGQLVSKFYEQAPKTGVIDIYFGKELAAMAHQWIDAKKTS